MKIVVIFFLIIQASAVTAQTKMAGGKITNLVSNKESRVMLSNGWSLTPAGRSLEVGDLPLNIAVSASGKLLAVTNNGQGKQSIQLIDAKNEKVLDNIEIPKSFYGLKFSSNEKYLYASAVMTTGS